MKYPITVTIVVDVPDQFLAVPVNNDQPAVQRPAPPSAAEAPKRRARTAVVPDKKPPHKRQREQWNDDVRRVNGQRINPAIARALAAIWKQGSAVGTQDAQSPFHHSRMSKMAQIGLLNRHSVEYQTNRGRQLRWEYELSDLGIEALAWAEKFYDMKPEDIQ